MATKGRPKPKTAGNFMAQVAKVSLKTTMIDVAKTMVEQNVRCVAVMDGDQIKGIITASDVIREIAADLHSPKMFKGDALEIMTARIVSVSEDDPLTQTLNSMTRPHMLHDLIVVHRLDAVGSISQVDVIGWWIDSVVNKTTET